MKTETGGRDRDRTTRVAAAGLSDGALGPDRGGDSKSGGTRGGERGGGGGGELVLAQEDVAGDVVDDIFRQAGE
jgi:hypothetical protein